LALIAVSRSRNPVLRWQTQDQHTARRYGTRSSVWSASLLAIKGKGIAKANRKAGKQEGRYKGLLPTARRQAGRIRLLKSEGRRPLGSRR
jgi:hypothetical protein